MKKTIYSQAIGLKNICYPQNNRYCYNDKGEEVFAFPHHDSMYSIDTLDNVKQWFAKVKHIYINVNAYKNEHWKYEYIILENDGHTYAYNNDFNEYDDALSEAINICIEMCKY